MNKWMKKLTAALCAAVLIVALAKINHRLKRWNKRL